MQYTKLGSSELLVSKICLGTMTWGEQNSESEGIDQLNKAFDEYGINFLDTAEMYPVPTKPESQGATDKIIGKWLNMKGRDRSKIILASKVAGASENVTWLPGRNGKGSRVSYNEIMKSVEESLKRLQTDYIDLLQIHWPDRYVSLFGGSPYDITQERESISFNEQLEALGQLIQQGKIRYFGVSNETPYGLMKFCQTAEEMGLPKPISIQNCYNLLNRCDIESGIIEVCSKRHENVGLLAYSPLAGGILTGKYSRADCPNRARLNLFSGYMERYKQSLAQEAVQKYCELAGLHGLTPTELALSWCYSRLPVTSTIIGATSIIQLDENIQAFGKQNLITEEVLEGIQEIYKKYRDPSKL